MYDWRLLPITEKQRKVIANISRHTKRIFQGKNRGEASDYIRSNLVSHNIVGEILDDKTDADVCDAVGLDMWYGAD